MFGGFAGLALCLAALGTYSVLSFMVMERRREIGVRMALGAMRSTILGAVVRHGLTVAVIGVAAGLASAYALTRLMRAILFGVTPGDPLTLASVAVGILIVAGTASVIAGLQATRLDPIVALRVD
jgi:ABC-type antimicrobial peptide transport system permease subunit